MRAAHDTGKINTPLFKAAFDASGEAVPPVMKRHYGLRPGTDDCITVEGTLNIRIAPFFGLLARITGLLVPFSGDNVPVTVTFTNAETGGKPAFAFNRIFHYPGRKRRVFRSRMTHERYNIYTEYMRYGLGWRFAFSFEGGKAVLRHKGYALKLGKYALPLPLTAFFGAGYAEETPLSENSFAMFTHVTHPLFGKIFSYSGTFTVTEAPCVEKYWF